MMLIWIILVVFAIAGVWYFSINPYKNSEEHSSLDIIENHFANGEMSMEEYKKRKAKLEKDGQVK